MSSDGTVIFIRTRLAWRKGQRAFAANAGGHMQFRLVAHAAHHMTRRSITTGFGFAADLNLADTPIVLNRTSVLQADGYRLAGLHSQRRRRKGKLLGRH